VIDMSVFSLSGKTALVAGASRGIGLAIAQQLAEAGARTTLAARSIDKLQEHAQALEAKGCQASALRLDLADSESIRAALEEPRDARYPGQRGRHEHPQELPAIHARRNTSTSCARTCMASWS
jgi:NAD(P)-dependent dehydrogenase (short-subunit alcohol dehydrogenase family)